MSITEFEDRLRMRLADRWQCPNPVGCDLSEVQSIESKMQIALPEYYKKFVLTCGAQAGGLFVEYDWRLEESALLNKHFRRCAREYGVLVPYGAFAFLDFMADYTWYFLSDGDTADPEVYMFDCVEFAKTGYKFFDFILTWEQFE